MHRFCILLSILLVFVATSSQTQLRFHPAIAMYCSKNTQHRNVQTGRWETDPSGKSDCLEEDSDMLDYCRKIYPGMSFTGVSRDSASIKIRSWCSPGHTGPVCRGHPHTVQPVICLTEDSSLDTKPGCSLQILSGKCQDISFWTDKAQRVCQSKEKMFSERQQPLQECSGGNVLGVQFTCCEKSKPVKKDVPSNDPCNLPRATGPCRAAFSYWYFDSESSSCRTFIYGGCGGNENRFENQQECEAKCNAASSVDSLKQPLIAMEPGLVLPSKPEAESEEKTQSTVSYFDSPLSPSEEQHLYSSALLNEVKEHKNKLASLMSQWSSAKTDLFHRGASPEEKQKLDDDMQATVGALKSEHQQKKQQLISAHQARMDAAIVGARTNSYNNFINKLNNPSTKNKQLVNAFKQYTQAEKRDQHHTTVLLNSKNVDNETSDSLRNKLQTIKSRVNNAVELAQQRLGESQTSSKISDIASDMFDLDTETTTPAPPPFDDVVEPEKPILIDHGGLPAENIDYSEPSFGDVYDGVDDDDNDDEYNDEEDDDDDDMFDDDGDDEFANLTPPPLLPSDFDMDNNFDQSLSDNYLDSQDNEDNYIEEDTDDDDDDDDDDDMPSPNFLVNQAGNYTERWLIWVGVAGVVIIVAVIGFAAVYFSRSRRYKRQQFARVEIDDHLTPEERQLLQMQQNGYENPTYKFFEKQKA